MNAARQLKIARDNLEIHSNELEAALIRGFVWGGDTFTDIANVVEGLQEDVERLEWSALRESVTGLESVVLADDSSIEVHIDF